ncbi:hypothetical protein AMTR_s00067p00190600 [Amborella trichopoda]|uniref:Fatty acid hydroxylase domain-containing protein n=2 Tax=Amborella trichopoda TaxID=13333 RepID=U5DBX7_AMBTC|nr:hypothetical protein AMTR_s00067p00190600 [Amborella trichopoda]
MLSRLAHNQLWISLSRFQTARSKHIILSKGLEFQQVDRERNWDDQIIFNGILFYLGSLYFPGGSNLPLWNIKGVIITIICHIGPVEFLYYWAHRALHHHFLYSRYHSHHHSSVVTEPITSVVHPFAEHILYSFLFAIALLTTLYTRTASIISLVAYITYIDFMNNMGHCNYEFIPKCLFQHFPFLNYIMYTPSFHSLHHSRVHTNFSLFMPIYDYIYNTVDKSTDAVYESAIEGREEAIDVVHLTHPTTLHSIYQMRLGFACLAAQPQDRKWYLWLLWPITVGLMSLMWIFDRTFTVEKNRLEKLNTQTWAIPRFTFQYSLKSQHEAINKLIEDAIIEAEKRGVKVLSLGLLNQDETLNANGELYFEKLKGLKIKLVDGCTLAAACVLNSIPPNTSEVLIQGPLSKTGYAVAMALCRRGTKVITECPDHLEKLRMQISIQHQANLIHAPGCHCKVWLVGDRMNNEKKALRGTIFIPFSQFPLKIMRKDCIYLSTPAMIVPSNLENMHACENWLPRRVMSAWRVGGILNALEGWATHECGDTMLDPEKVWSSALNRGFLPFDSDHNSQP